MSACVSRQPAMRAHQCQNVPGVRKSLAGWALLPCLAVLDFGQAGFVRRRQVPFNKDTRMLSARIKSAETAGELLDVVGRSVDEPVFNYIHAAAAYTRLGNLRKKGLLCAKEVDSDVLVRLGQRLQGMLLRREVGTLALANIFWAAASLFTDMPRPQCWRLCQLLRSGFLAGLETWSRSTCPTTCGRQRSSRMPCQMR